MNPFTALGLPVRPDLTDEQVRAAWRTIAASTHPDRPDGGNPARYAAASAAYGQLRTTWGRSEAYADLATGQPYVPAPAAQHPRTPGAGIVRAALLLPARIRHGRPLRLLLRAIATLAIGRDVSITIFTASSLNSGEKLFFGRDKLLHLSRRPS